MYKVTIEHYDGMAQVLSFYNKPDVRRYIWEHGCRVKNWTVNCNGKDISRQFI